VKPVNLNKVRKQKTRTEAKVRADVNTAKFGRNKVERASDAIALDKGTRRLEAHRREKP
jgi:Domain of unknown function (DUF4169)